MESLKKKQVLLNINYARHKNIQNTGFGFAGEAKL